MNINYPSNKILIKKGEILLLAEVQPVIPPPKKEKLTNHLKINSIRYTPVFCIKPIRYWNIRNLIYRFTWMDCDAFKEYLSFIF